MIKDVRMKIKYNKYRKGWEVIITRGIFEEILFESKEKIYCQVFKQQRQQISKGVIK